MAKTKEYEDYTGAFAGKIGRKLSSYVIPVFITLIGVFLTSFLGDVSTWNLTEKIGVMVLLGIGLLALFAIYFGIADIINSRIHRGKASGLEFPYGLTIEDICPYTIEEERTEKVYSLDKSNGNFDVVNTITYKVKGGCSKVDFINHTFGGFHLNKEDDLTVELESISGSPVIEVQPIIAKSKSHCILRAEFGTGLLPSQEAVYKIILSYRNYQTICQSGDNSDHVLHSKRAGLETKRLALSIEFPKKYRVLQPELLVESTSDVRIGKVERFCSEENAAFGEQLGNDPIKLSMTVRNPVPSLNYVLSWKLPHRALLVKNKFFDEPQINPQEG